MGFGISVHLIGLKFSWLLSSKEPYEEAIEAIHTNIYMDQFRSSKILNEDFKLGFEELVDDCCS